MKRLKKLLAFLLIVWTLLQISIMVPQTAKASTYPNKPTTSSYNYNLATGDNLIAPYNSMLIDESQLNTSFKDGMTGNFTFRDWNIKNDVNGKVYASGGTYGNYGGYITGGLQLKNGQAQISLSDLSISGANTDMTVSFWYKWDGTNGAMPIGFGSFSLYISDGFFGFNTAQDDVYGVQTPFKQGQYTHIIAHFMQGNYSTSELYVNGVKQSLKQMQKTSLGSNINFNASTVAINGSPGSIYYRAGDNAYIDELCFWNRGLSSSEADNLYRSYTHSYSYIKNGMVGKFTFDNGSATNEINGKTYDLSGNQIVNGNGKKENCLNLSGASVNVPLSDLGFDGTEQYSTYSFWLRSDQVRTYKQSLYWYNPDSLFDLYECEGYFGINTAMGDNYGTFSPFSATSWHHVVVVFKQHDINACQIYIDSERRELKQMNLSASCNAIKWSKDTVFKMNHPNFGLSEYDYSYHGTGDMDEVCIWNRPLSDSEVKSLYESYGKDTGKNNYQSYWDTFSYGGGNSATSISINNDTTLGMNYLHLLSVGKNGTGIDSGAVLKVENLKANTWYTASGYVRADNATTWGKGLFCIINSANNSGLNASSIDNVDISNTWVRNSVTFNTGSNTSIFWRINRGDHNFVDVTGLKLEEGKYATPFISYNESKTYAYGVMDNLISPSDSYFLTDGNALPSKATPQNNWSLFNYGGVPSTSLLQYKGYNNYNYYHLTPSGGTAGASDSGVILNVPNLEQNTDYTVSAWMRIPSTTINNGNGRIFVTNSDNSAGIASFNPKDSNGNDTTNTNDTWQLVQGSFNTGSNSSINIRIDRSDAAYLDFTLLSLQGGKNPIPIENGAYSGIVSPYKVIFTPGGRQINHHNPVGMTSGRNVTLHDSYTDSSWYTSSGQMWTPETLNKSYYDAQTGQIFNFSLNKSGSVYSFASGQQSYTTTEYQTVTDWDYAYSYGNRYNYDPYGHTTLGYMSNNTNTYYGGSFSYYASIPRKPDNFYAPQAVSDPYGWECIDRQWAEDFVVDSFWWFGYGQYWISNKDSGEVKNRYRKGVNLKYRKWRTFSQPVTVTKYNNVWRYKQDYSGTFSLPDAVNHYEDYTTTTKWNVKVDYTGTLKPTNLKALSIGIYTEGGTATSSIQAGQTYVAKVQYNNDGDVNVNTSFNIGLYDERGNKVNGLVVTSANSGTTSTANLAFTMAIPGNHTFKAVIDDGNKIAEVNEIDNDVSTGVINAYAINIKTTSLSIVGLTDEKVQTSLELGKQYRAKIKVKNDGGQDVGTFNIGLYGLQAPPPEDTYVFPAVSTQIGTDYMVIGGLKVGEELGVTTGKDYAYITFTANSTDIHNFSAWADNLDVIKESNEYDNVKSLAINTLAYNVKSNSLLFVDIATGATTTTLYKNRQYKAMFSITNDQNTDLVPVQVGLYDGIVGSGAAFPNPSNYQLLSGQTIPDGEIYFTPQVAGVSKNYYVKADNDDDYDETNETDNFKSQTVNVYDKNITATSIQILDSGNNPVTYLTQGYSYKVNITIKNSGDIDINEPFNIGLKVNGVLQTTKVVYLGALSKGTTKTATISFTASNTGAYNFTGVADCDNQVWESNESDNDVSSSLTSYTVNLRADSIDVVGLSDNNSISTLQVGKQYRAVIKFTNTGQLTASNLQVSLSQNGTSIGTPAIVSNFAPNNQAIVYITFTANTRGNLTFEGFVDSTNVIQETNENDNKVQTVKAGVRVNLVATSIDIVGTGDIAGKDYLIQNQPYRAMISIKNDGDTSVGSFQVRLDECISPSGTTQTDGTVNVPSLNAGATTTVYINLNHQNRGLRRFTAVVDSANVINETDETDNTVFTDKTVNRVNIKALVIDIQDTKGVSQNVLQKNLNYNAKVQLINDGDVNIGAFSLGLYDNGVRIASLSIASLNTGAATTTFTIPFIPQNTGSRTLMAFADDNLQIVESDEMDNKVQCVVTINDLMLINYRIVSMVNAPSPYDYPLDITKMPVGVKSGYNVTFQVDVVGVADTITVDFYDDSTLNNKTVSFTKIKDVDTTHSTWQVVVNTDMNTPINTIVNSVVKGSKGTFVYNYNNANNWDGQTLKIVGSALEDFMINRTQ